MLQPSLTKVAIWFSTLVGPLFAGWLIFFKQNYSEQHLIGQLLIGMGGLVIYSAIFQVALVVSVCQARK